MLNMVLCAKKPNSVTTPFSHFFAIWNKYLNKENLVDEIKIYTKALNVNLEKVAQKKDMST